MSRELVQAECRGRCDWHPTPELVDQQRVFACGGCGSEWTADQGWTPRNADGEVSAEVLAEKSAAQQRSLAAASDIANEAAGSGDGAGGGSIGSW